MFHKFKWIVNYLNKIPNACVLCHQKAIGPQNLVCQYCLSDVEIYPSGTDQLSKLIINQNQYQSLDGLLVCNKYIWPFNDWIISLKFSQKRFYARALGHCLSQIIPEQYQSIFDYYIPVPLHYERLKSRGYNQTELICQFSDKLQSIKQLTGVCRIKNTQPQTKLTKTRRNSNIKGAFSCKRPLHGSRILIVDDVVSTGSTIDELASCLKRQGATYVVALAICYNS